MADPSAVLAATISSTSGDNVYTLDGYKYHEFNNAGSANFVISSGSGNVEYLIVAGGGGGASAGAGLHSLAAAGSMGMGMGSPIKVDAAMASRGLSMNNLIRK